MPGATNTLFTMGLYYGAYSAYIAIPHLATNMYIWGGLAGVLSIFNVGRFMDSRQSIVRIYLLQNLNIVRLVNNNGSW